MKFNSLRTKLLFWTGLFLLCMGITIIAFVTVFLRDTAIKNAKEQIHALARERAEHLLTELNAITNRPRILAEILSGVSNPLEPLAVAREQVDKMLISLLKSNKHIVGVYIAWLPNAFDNKDQLYINEPGHDKSGRYAPYWYRNSSDMVVVCPLLTGIGDDLSVPINTITEERLIAPNRRWIEDKSVSVISIIVPVVYKNQVNAIIGLDINVNFIQNFTEQIGLGKYDGGIVVLTSNGQLLGTVGAHPLQKGQVGKPDFYEAYFGHFQKKIEFWKYSENIFEFYVPLQVSGSEYWWVSIALPRDIVLAKAERLTWYLVAIGVMIIVLAILLLYILAGHIVNPLKLFVENVKIIAKGEYGRKLENVVGGQDEIGQLVVAFNDMSWQLEDRKTKLELFLTELESKNLDMQYEIADRLEAENALRKERDKLEVITKNIGAGICIISKEYTVIWANVVINGLFGDVRGKACYRAFYQHDEICPNCGVRKIFEFGEKKVSYEQKGIDSTGKTIWSQLISTPLIDEQGNVSGALEVVMPITERKLAEEEKIKLEGQLRQAQKLEAIGTLAGGIAHDFNNILTPVLGYADMVLKQLPEGSKLRKRQESVIKAANRAKELVREILTFSRQQEEAYLSIQLHPIIKEVLRLLRSTIPTTIEIRQNIDQNSGWVMADPILIHQMVMNFCINAYHAMRDTGGVLSITLSDIDIDSGDYVALKLLKAGAYVKLEVSDTGCGMSPEVKERIFEPYFTTKKVGEGTGLGLSTIHGIVKNLQGHISVYSEPEKGSAFNVYLPKINGAPFEVDAFTDQELMTGNEKILVVDDEIEIIQFVQEVLQNLGYEVMTFADSTEAYLEFEKTPNDFDLVLTDMNIPKLNGAELAKKILAIRSNIPVILCSGFSEIMDEEKAKAIGIREYVQKPIVQKELATIVRKVLDDTSKKL